jgi:TonB family protein
MGKYNLSRRDVAGLSVVLLAGSLVAGCTGLGDITEHPVNNAISPLPPGVYAVEAVDVRPVAIHEVQPDYPPELAEILEGKALVTFTVRTNGKVTDPLVVQADDVLYGEAAVAALSKWRFRPAQLKGAAVDCRMTLPFDFDSPYGYDSRYGAGGLPPDAPPDPSFKTKVESR